MQVTAELEQQRLVESGLHAEVAAREKEQARLEHELLRLQQAQIQAEAREKEQVRLEQLKALPFAELPSLPPAWRACSVSICTYVLSICTYVPVSTNTDAAPLPPAWRMSTRAQRDVCVSICTHVPVKQVN